MRELAVALCVLLSGCATVATPKIDEKYLQFCEKPPPLEGFDGEAIMEWAKTAGPMIETCRTNNNALVMILKNSK